MSEEKKCEISQKKVREIMRKFATTSSWFFLQEARLKVFSAFNTELLAAFSI